jgi:hypothetical protein
MRKILALSGVVLTSLLISGSAFAQGAPPAEGGGAGGERPASAVEVGLRAGYSIPLGDVADKASFSDTGVSGVIPIQADVGYKINPNILVGAYFSYGIGMTNSDKCKDCSFSQLRFGAQLHYYLMPNGQFDPWVGAGIGYEILSESNSELSAKGLEYVNLQAGADYRLNGNLGLGPVIQFGLGSYGSASVKGTDVPGFKSATHEFLTIGVRGIYDIGL